ncbi:hypothetical protein ACFXJ5_14630 [Streptomyces sp. NPDC059373]
MPPTPEAHLEMVHSTLTRCSAAPADGRERDTGVEADEYRISRSWVLRRGDSYPVREWFDVVAPTMARDRVRPGFAGAWRTPGLGTEQLAMTGPVRAWLGLATRVAGGR